MAHTDPKFTTLLRHPQPSFTLPNWHGGRYGEMHLHLHEYPATSGALCVALASNAGELLAKISVNLIDISTIIPVGQFFAKNYSEGDGLCEALEATGVIRNTGKIVVGDYGIVLLMELLPPHIPQPIVWIASVRDRANFTVACARQAFTTREAAEKWAAEQCEMFTAEDITKGVPMYCIDYDYIILDLPLHT